MIWHFVKKTRNYIISCLDLWKPQSGDKNGDLEHDTTFYNTIISTKSIGSKWMPERSQPETDPKYKLRTFAFFFAEFYIVTHKWKAI